MSLNLLQDFFRQTVSIAWTTGAGNKYVSVKPTIANGYLVLSPSNSTLREIVRYTGTGTDANGDYVTIAVAGDRGLGGTTNQVHAVGEAVRMNFTAEHWADLDATINSIIAAGAPNASNTVKGISTLSVAPASPTAPIAVCANDPKLPTADPTTLFASLAASLPVGTTVPYMGLTAPTNFVLADGTTYDCDTYPSLAVVSAGMFGLGTLVTFTAANATDIVTAAAHGLSNTNIVYLQNSGGALPAGLSANTPYYIISVTINTFQLSLTSGGSAVNFTTDGTGTNSFSNSFKVVDLRSSFPMGAGTRVNTATFDANSGVNTATDVITINSGANDWLQTGQAVALTGAALPTGLTAGTYYVIRVTSTTIKLASSLANAQNGTQVDITAVGSGTATLTQTLTARSVGYVGGEETHAMSSIEILAHAHTYTTNNISTTSNGVPQGSNGGGTNFSNTTDSFGGNNSMNNIGPFSVLNYIIRAQ